MNKKEFLWDISGAFGDIGVLIPIAIALIGKNGFNPTLLFALAGIFYLVSAWYYRITMPVQPLKAMAAIAIASQLGVDVIAVAAILMGLILLALSLSGLSERLAVIFPIGVIRGIQLGLGAILIKTSFQMAQTQLRYAGVALLILGASFLLRKWIPPLLPLLIAGLVWALTSAPPVSLGPAPITLTLPAFDKLWEALTLLVLPQIALSFGNAIVATENTARLLYGPRASRVSLRAIPLGMGIANIVIGLFGGMPLCHGSGGLTAHVKFGATSERSGFIIGFALLLLALVFGNSALSLISAFPTGFLAVLLFYVGASHAGFVRDIRHDRWQLVVALSTAIGGMLTGNLTYGFLLGIALHKLNALRQGRTAPNRIN